MLNFKCAYFKKCFNNIYRGPYTIKNQKSKVRRLNEDRDQPGRPREIRPKHPLTFGFSLFEQVVFGLGGTLHARHACTAAPLRLNSVLHLGYVCRVARPLELSWDQNVQHKTEED